MTNICEMEALVSIRIYYDLVAYWTGVCFVVLRLKAMSILLWGIDGSRGDSGIGPSTF